MQPTGAMLCTNANLQRAYDGIKVGWNKHLCDLVTLEASGDDRSQANASFASNVVQNDPIFVPTNFCRAEFLVLEFATQGIP